MTGPWRPSDEVRQTLAGLADELIPPAESELSASEAGVHTTWLDAVLTHRPDLADGLLALLRDAHGEDPQAFLRSR